MNSALMKQSLLSVLELYEWELQQVPFVNSVIGRHVYACMARQILQARASGGSVRSVKSVLSSPNFTDRAIRLKIREMEREGYLQSVSHEQDKRVRQLVPSDKLVALVERHAEAMTRIMDREFIVLPK